MVQTSRVQMEDSLSRRAVMASLVVVSGGAVLAACGSSSGGSSSGGSSSGGSSSGASAPTGAPSASSAGAGTTSSPSARPVPPPTGTGKAIVALAKVPVGGSVSVLLDGKPIIVGQPTAGKVVAFTAICTHMGCPVKPAGATLQCPCHGSVYDARTGHNISGPAPKPLAAIPVSVSKGNIVAA